MAAIGPSTVPLYGGTTAVAFMSNNQLACYLINSVTTAAGPVPSLTAGRITPLPDSLIARLADNRGLVDSTGQDAADRDYIIATLGIRGV